MQGVKNKIPANQSRVHLGLSSARPQYPMKPTFFSIPYHSPLVLRPLQTFRLARATWVAVGSP